MKKIKSLLTSRATASLKRSVQEDLREEDKPLKSLLEQEEDNDGDDARDDRSGKRP